MMALPIGGGSTKPSERASRGDAIGAAPAIGLTVLDAIDVPIVP